MRVERTEVLVVGAGPIGLWTALRLAQAGLEVTIVDRENRTTARSYACALHPATLKLLKNTGLAEPILALGRRVEKVAFYDGKERQDEIDLRKLGGEFPFLVILPQSALESTLEHALKQKGVTVHWNHRLDSFEEEAEMVAADIQELGGTSTGYIVPHWETVVKSSFPLRARFLVGTDGPNSVVRQQAGIGLDRLSGPAFFAAYEFEPEEAVENEVRVVLSETTNVLWPLSGNKYRWTFQLIHSEMARDFPEKERRAVRLMDRNLDEQLRQYVQAVALKRAPWFKARVKDVSWCTEVVFEQRLAKRFGEKLCWLAGDAAHQTGPVGVQSMNVGFAEGERLADAIRSIVKDDARPDVLANYDRECQREWRELLGAGGGLKAASHAKPWTRGHCARLLPCLPAANGDLAILAGQLGLEF